MDRYLGSLKGVSNSVQLLSNGIEAVLIPTLIILKQPALRILVVMLNGPSRPCSALLCFGSGRPS